MDIPFLSPKENNSLLELINMLSNQDSSELNANVEERVQTVMITEVIEVPTCEHVAQIVGKSGSKIKSLRAKTNTCIKTPLRGDHPMFTITGTPEDVRMARLAIQHASQHFSSLMSQRSNNCGPGEVTIQVPVPQEYVGVVVGRGGTVIMKIKEQTNTRINTPKDNAYNSAFEVTGSQVNVLAAKEAIEEKVRQAFQLRSSSIFDPNLNHNKYRLNRMIEMPVQQVFNPLPQIRAPIDRFQTFPTYNIPIGSQSTSVMTDSDKKKAENARNNGNHNKTDNEIGNILYENFYGNNNSALPFRQSFGFNFNH